MDLLESWAGVELEEISEGDILVCVEVLVGPEDALGDLVVPERSAH